MKKLKIKKKEGLITINLIVFYFLGLIFDIDLGVWYE